MTYAVRRAHNNNGNLIPPSYPISMYYWWAIDPGCYCFPIQKSWKPIFFFFFFYTTSKSANCLLLLHPAMGLVFHRQRRALRQLAAHPLFVFRLSFFRAWWLSRGFSLLLATSGCAETVPVVKWPMICWHILDGCAAVQSPCITNNMLCHRQWMYIYPRDTLRRPLKLLDDVARKSSSFLFRKEADQSSGRLRL